MRWLRQFSVRLTACFCLCITQYGVSNAQTGTQQVTPTAPVVQTAAVPLGADQPAMPAELPQAPSAERFPLAVAVPPPAEQKVVIEADKQSRNGDRLLLQGNVSLTYGAYRVDADRVEYDEATGELEATGHLHASGANNSESINASHATVNIRTETGRFYDVHGSIGMRATARGTMYTTDNPFLFTGRMVVKTGPAEFEIYDGTVTSCQLPRPDWQLAAAKFTLGGGKARAYKTTFKLLNVPIFFLPYATHPTKEGERQTGFLIPVIGQSSTKGFVLGEQIYFALSRSMDLTVGAEYFSRRGWQQSATYRYRGAGLNFVQGHYGGLLDRGFVQSVTDANGNTTNVFTNQGGEDVTLSGRYDLSDHTRVAADVEYLSSFVYRQAFTDNFNQAVSSDITSYVYGTHAVNGYVASLEADRYQGLKQVTTGQQIRIFRAPLLEAEALERHPGKSPLVWSVLTQFAALKRTQGTPTTNGFATDFVGRLDVHPRMSLPFSLAGFRFRPVVGLRDTYYTRSRTPTLLPGPTPVEVQVPLNRLLTEAEIEVRAPILEKTYDTGVFSRLLGLQARHTIEPELRYRYADGADDYLKTLRFDMTDVVTNKNELEYGFTQRLFLRPSRQHECDAGETPTETGATCGGTRETLRWRIVERTYFDDSFSNVLSIGRRNVLDNTLDLSGVAFLTEKRSVSPIVSEMKLSATDHFDVEWDMNYDTHAGKFTQSNTFIDFHAGNYFGGLSHARLNAPGRFQTGTTTSLTSDFSQLRVLMGYGTPTKQGLSVAANAGIDLKLAQVQYGATQVSYNWNCCGLSVEYRKYELGSVRNENAYRFNFTLANIGTAGNIRRTERLF